MRVTIVCLLVAAIYARSTIYSALGSDKTFNFQSLSYCTNQCVERLLGVPEFINKDNMKFVCCQKFASTTEKKCV